MYKAIIIFIIIFCLQIVAPNNGFSGDETKDNAAVILDDIKTNDHKDSPLPQDFPYLKSMIKALVIVFGLMVVFFFFVKRKYRHFSGRTANNKKYIQVIEYLPLGPKKHLYLVKVLNKLMVVGATNDGLYSMGELGESSELELPEMQDTSSGGGFSSFIKRLTNKQGKTI